MSSKPTANNRYTIGIAYSDASAVAVSLRWPPALGPGPRRKPTRQQNAVGGLKDRFAANNSNASNTDRIDGIL